MTTTFASTQRMEVMHVPLPGSPEQQVALHYVEPSRPSDQVVLFIHGSTYPTRLSTGFEFTPGDSWACHAAGQGLLSCSLDLIGYGASSRSAVQGKPAGDAPPQDTLTSEVEQIAAAIDAIRRKWNVTTVHLVAHSHGTMPGAAFAAAHPTALHSLTLFGPLVPIAGYALEPVFSEPVRGEWFRVTADERFERLHREGMTPAGKLMLEPAVEARWASELAAAHPPIGDDKPGELRIPCGPNADIQAMQNGTYPYAPEQVQTPVFVVFGNYDDVVDDPSAKAFLARFTGSPMKWQLRIDEGTHSMQLEHNRHSLYAAVDAFIRATMVKPSSSP